jgi:hypothetical protein
VVGVPAVIVVVDASIPPAPAPALRLFPPPPPPPATTKYSTVNVSTRVIISVNSCTTPHPARSTAATENLKTVSTKYIPTVQVIIPVVEARENPAGKLDVATKYSALVATKLIVVLLPDGKLPRLDAVTHVTFEA